MPLLDVVVEFTQLLHIIVPRGLDQVVDECSVSEETSSSLGSSRGPEEEKAQLPLGVVLFRRGAAIETRLRAFRRESNAGTM